MAGSEYYWLLLLLVIPVIVLVLFLLRRNSCVMDLEKKAVLITGCDSGFGFDVAKRLDKLGVTVFAGCLFPEGRGAASLKCACSDNLHILKLDVTSEDEIQEAVSFVQSHIQDKEFWGVVNNAGIATVGYIEWMTVDVIKRIFEVNTLGPFRVTKAFLPLLRKSQGRIVIVASLGGVYPLQGCAAYSMSKHAVVSLAHSLRRELAQFNISAHLVNPASYQTPILSIPIAEELRSHWRKLPEEIRSAYDENSIDKFESEVLNEWKQFAKPESKIYEVTEAILHAIISKQPKTVYVPGLLAKLQFFLLSITSTKAMDALSKTNLRFLSMMRKSKLRHRSRTEV